MHTGQQPRQTIRRRIRRLTLRRSLATAAVVATVLASAVAAHTSAAAAPSAPPQRQPGRRAHRHVRQALADDRRAAHVRLVRRVPPVPAAQPEPVARRPAEDEGRGLHGGLDLLRLGLPLGQARRLRLQRRARHGQAARHRRSGRAVRDRPARPVHQRRGHRGWFPRVAHHAGRAGALRRPGLSRRRRRMVQPHRRDPGPASAHERHRVGDPVPDRERARLDRHIAAQLHAAHGRQGARRRRHRPDLQQRQGPQRHLGAEQFDRAGHRARPRRPVRVRRIPRRHLPHRQLRRRAVHRARLGHPGRGRREGRLDRLAGNPWIRSGIRRRLVRLLGQPRLLPVHGDPRRPRLRKGFLRDEHRQRPDAAELLHDVRRDVVGLAARSGRLHVIRLRRGDRRGAPIAAEGDGNARDRVPAAVGAGHRRCRQGF